MNYSLSDSLLKQKMQKSVSDRINDYPAKYESIYNLGDGRILLIRPVKPTDEKNVQELHYSLDEQDRYYRFFSYAQDFGDNKIQELVNINYNADMVLVAEYNEKEKHYLVSIGGFFQKLNPTVGEFILLTHKNWRGLGIGRFIINNLIKIARDFNYTKLGGAFCLENKPILHIINSGEYKLNLKKINNEITVFIIDITD